MVLVEMLPKIHYSFHSRQYLHHHKQQKGWLEFPARELKWQSSPGW
jgi:hypothetical protein